MTDETMTADLLGELNAYPSFLARSGSALADTGYGVMLALEKVLTCVALVVVVGALGAFVIDRAALELEATGPINSLIASAGDALRPILAQLGAG